MQFDIQGHGEINNGNWLSGINFMDALRLGPQNNLPKHLKDNKGRNTFYFLPFLLGLIGLFFHLIKRPKDAWAIFLLFFFTGLAIVIELNQTPFQPRERDYAYVGSFYDFTSSEKSKLRKHTESVHEGKKPYKCSICDYTCSTKQTLNNDHPCIVPLWPPLMSTHQWRQNCTAG